MYKQRYWRYIVATFSVFWVCLMFTKTEEAAMIRQKVFFLNGSFEIHWPLFTLQLTEGERKPDDIFFVKMLFLFNKEYSGVSVKVDNIFQTLLENFR